MAKSRDAFRTISEVAEWLDTPAHVLRFWESKFSQVKPVKRAGGRRYYRPADMELLGGIKKLLHDEGMTIKGVQKVLREQGVKHVSALSESAEASEDVIADAPYIDAPEAADIVVHFVSPETEPGLSEPEPVTTPEPDTSDAVPVEPAAQDNLEFADTEAAVTTMTQEEAAQPVAEKPVLEAAPDAPEPEPQVGDAAQADVSEEVPKEDGFADDSSQSPIPAFLKEPLAPETAPEPEESEPAEAQVIESSAPPKAIAPKVIPPLPDLDSIRVAPGVLSALAGLARLSAQDAARLAPIVADLRDLQDRLITPDR